MRSPRLSTSLRSPQLITQTRKLGSFLRTLSPKQIEKIMHVSPTLAHKTHNLLANWSTAPRKQSIAIDSFVGDIYSGLRADELTPNDRDYADKTLCILSGLYGIIRPYDGISPYRLEMAYRLPDPAFANLYKFWNDSIAKCLPKEGTIVNVSSVEYTKAVLPFIDKERIITPRFLTINPKTNEPTFVVVHAKIARGAFARWLITSRTTNIAEFPEFSDIGYQYNQELSTPNEPVFICQTFGGIGLSMRLN
jgi:cytoplasmic iron level regulating protein YaaA (DUF328/UPF0246 family)